MEIIRDPIWNNIRVDALALELVDTPVFQRLRYVRQLGLTYLVYPGATHTRFEHALGAYHLCRIAIALLRERGIADVSEEECTITTIAALLHDVGHYPFSHALEEIGATHHEEVATALVTTGIVASILRARIGENAPEQIIALIRGQADTPLQGLVSGSLDLDKIEYLKRDAHMCGVAYGEIDVDRLINSMVLVGDPVTGLQTVGVAEKGLSALESLLFAKYQMYRNVYWHHAVRSATAMYKRLVEDACIDGVLKQDQLASFTDEGLLYFLEHRAPSPLLSALRSRHLFKRVVEWPASELDDESRAPPRRNSRAFDRPRDLRRDQPAAPFRRAISLCALATGVYRNARGRQRRRHHAYDRRLLRSAILTAPPRPFPLNCNQVMA